MIRCDANQLKRTGENKHHEANAHGLNWMGRTEMCDRTCSFEHEHLLNLVIVTKAHSISPRRFLQGNVRESGALRGVKTDSLTTISIEDKYRRSTGQKVDR